MCGCGSAGDMVQWFSELGNAGITLGLEDLRSSHLNVFMTLWFLPTLNRNKAIWDLIPDI